MNRQLAAWQSNLLQRQTSMTQAWRSRTPRERNFLFLAAMLIITTLFFLLLLLPALEGRAQLQRSLPQLRIQAAQLRGMANDVAELPPATEQASPLSRKKVESVLQQHGLKAQAIDISDNSVRLQFKETPFAPLLDCLETLQKVQQLSVADASFSTQNKAGTVNATLQLNRQINE